MIPEKRQDVWNAEIHTPGPRHQNIGSLSARSSSYDADDYNGHLPTNTKSSHVDNHVWTNQSSSHSTQNFVTQRHDRPVHTSSATSYIGHQSLSSPPRQMRTTTRMTMPSNIQMRPFVAAHGERMPIVPDIHDYPNFYRDHRYQGAVAAEIPQASAWNVRQDQKHQDVVGDNQSKRQKLSKDDELKRMKDEMQVMKGNIARMAKLILKMIENDVNNQQIQEHQNLPEYEFGRKYVTEGIPVSSYKMDVRKPSKQKLHPGERLQSTGFVEKNNFIPGSSPFRPELSDYVSHIIPPEIAFESQQYPNVSQHISNDVYGQPEKVKTRNLHNGISKFNAEVQPFDLHHKPWVVQPLGFERRGASFIDNSKKENKQYMPESANCPSDESRQIHETEMTFGAGNSPISYPPTSGLPTYKSDNPGHEELKFKRQHSMDFQRYESNLVHEQCIWPPQQSSYRPEHNLLSSALKAQSKEYDDESSSQKEKHSDRKRVMSLSYHTEEDAIPSKNLRQNQMNHSSTLPGQSVLSSHPTRACTIQSPFAIHTNAWNKPPQQQFVYESGVVNQPPLIYREMHEKNIFHQKGFKEKFTRKEKARKCYSCREPGHFADSCCKAAGPNITDDLSATNDTALDLSISKY